MTADMQRRRVARSRKMLKNCRTKRERDNWEKWLSTLTIRQVQVLAAVAFGEYYLQVSRYQGREWPQWTVDDMVAPGVKKETNVNGVINVLAKKKMIRHERLAAMDSHHSLVEIRLLVLTDKGAQAIQDRPELWNE